MPRIAVIEDNPDNRLLVQVLLEDAYELEQYPSGEEGLAGMREQVPDLLLLDISLPGMDGPEVLRRMKTEEALARIPVIALTAHAMAGDREEYMRSGFDGYVAKPITDEAILLAAIGRLLTRAAA